MARHTFNPATMRLNRAGRAVWTDPPAGERMGGFPRGGVSYPNATPAPSAEPAPEQPQQGVGLEVSEPAAEPAPPSRAAPDASLLQELGGVPLPEVEGPSEVEAPEVEAGSFEVEELGAEVGRAELVRDHPPIGEDSTEARGFATLHELLVNRFAAAHPRPYTERERADVAAACAVTLNRYGGGLSQHAPLVSLAMVTTSTVVERMTVACASCGEPTPEGARYCGACGASQGGAGGACIQACGVAGMPAGTRFCFGCGAAQVASGSK